MKANELAVLAISGFNMRAVIALCRFCGASEMPIHLVALNESDPIYLTSYRNRVFLERHAPTLAVSDFCDWLLQLKQRFGYKRILIAPSCEFFNRFLLDNRARVESCGGIVPLVGKALYESISDKYSFSEMCRTSGIKVPAQYDVPPAQFPFVAKPLQYAAPDGRQLKPYLLGHADDWRDFEKKERFSDFYYQEFVCGQSLYLLMHLSRAGGVLKYSQENLIQQAGGGSIVLARRSDFHLAQESDRYVALLKQNGFHGLIMIEVRLNEKTGEFVMIEANPRMWGPIQFALDNSVDLFGALVCDFTGDFPHRFNSTVSCADYYFWSGGVSGAGKPFAYHDFSPSGLVNDFHKIAACDLFRRADTLALYEHELTL